jgi:hypothetical protein
MDQIGVRLRRKGSSRVGSALIVGGPLLGVPVKQFFSNGSRARNGRFRNGHDFVGIRAYPLKQ